MPPISLDGMKLVLAALRIPPFDKLEIDPENSAGADETPSIGSPRRTASTF